MTDAPATRRVYVTPTTDAERLTCGSAVPRDFATQHDAECFAIGHHYVELTRLRRSGGSKERLNSAELAVYQHTARALSLAPNGTKA